MSKRRYVAPLVFMVMLAGCTHNPPSQRRVLYYYDPMHPAYTSDRPGIAPDCNMKLAARYADETVNEGGIRLTADQQRAAGIDIVTASEQTGRREIRVPGRVEPVESRRYKVSVGADGWIRNVQAGDTGSIVSRGQVLATYFSREVAAPQQAYLYALDAVDRVLKLPGHTEDQLAQATRQLNLAHDSLAQLGMNEEQITEVGRSRAEIRELTLVAPASGVVTLRSAAAGMRFSKGEDLFEIASLDTVWIEASVFPSDAGALVGQTSATATAPNGTRIPLRTVPSIARFGSEAESVASRVRLQADNPAKLLLPGMYVVVVFELAMPPGLAVPVEAVVQSGDGAHVFVRRADGAFELRRVSTGWRASGLVQVTAGLSAGEPVARSGVFLLDSETQIRSAGVLP